MNVTVISLVSLLLIFVLMWLNIILMSNIASLRLKVKYSQNTFEREFKKIDNKINYLKYDFDNIERKLRSNLSEIKYEFKQLKYNFNSIENKLNNNFNNSKYEFKALISKIDYLKE